MTKMKNAGISKAAISDSQKKIFKQALKYLDEHLLEFEVLITIGAMLGLLRTLPYFNIYLGANIIFFILFVSASILFKLPKVVVLAVTLLLFPVSFFFLLRGGDAGAEEVGNLIYFLMWYVAVLYWRELWNLLKKQS